MIRSNPTSNIIPAIPIAQSAVAAVIRSEVRSGLTPAAETDQLSAALLEAAKIWPELADQRTLLLRKVLEVGIETIEGQAKQNTKGRLAKVQEIAGSMDGVWPANWRKELAEDWPI